MQTTSLTIEWHNWGLCCGDDMVLEKTTISHATNTIRIHQTNGRRETVHDEFVKVSEDEIRGLFSMIDQIIENGGWKPDYYLNGCDGSAWKMLIRRGSASQIKVQGAYMNPPHGEEIERRIRQMLRNANAQIDPELFCACK